MGAERDGGEAEAEEVETVPMVRELVAEDR